MTDWERLDTLIKDSGLKRKALSEKTGIPVYTLDRIFKSHRELSAKEIVGFAKALKMTKSTRDEIFLSSNVNNIHKENNDGKNSDANESDTG